MQVKVRARWHSWASMLPLTQRTHNKQWQVAATEYIHSMCHVYPITNYLTLGKYMSQFALSLGQTSGYFMFFFCFFFAIKINMEEIENQVTLNNCMRSLVSEIEMFVGYTYVMVENMLIVRFCVQKYTLLGSSFSVSRMQVLRLRNERLYPFLHILKHFQQKTLYFYAFTHTYTHRWRNIQLALWRKVGKKFNDSIKYCIYK